VCVTCRLTAKNRDHFRNPTLGNRVWATVTFLLGGAAITGILVRFQLHACAQAVPMSTIWGVLGACGHKYSTQSIVQSEMRVLKTLDYQLMIATPLVYVETLLAVLGDAFSSLFK